MHVTDAARENLIVGIWLTFQGAIDASELGEFRDSLASQADADEKGAGGDLPPLLQLLITEQRVTRQQGRDVMRQVRQIAPLLPEEWFGNGHSGGQTPLDLRHPDFDQFDAAWYTLIMGDQSYAARSSSKAQTTGEKNDPSSNTASLSHKDQPSALAETPAQPEGMGMDSTQPARPPSQDDAPLIPGNSALGLALRALSDLEEGQSPSSAPPSAFDRTSGNATGSAMGSGSGIDPHGSGRYRNLWPLGRGSLGVVTVTYDERMHRKIAVKRIQPHLVNDKEARRRFLREAQITGQLEHPDIVPVYDMETAGEPFYTMRLVRGKTLGDLIAEYHTHRQAGTHSRRELQDLLGMFVRICQAVAFAHSRGVVHRDLKPANIIIGEFGEVFVLDWGLAKILAGKCDSSMENIPSIVEDFTDLAQTAGILGTPLYMSPEQAEGSSELVSPASDIYSLGAILFEIITGESPHARFKNEKQGDFLRKIILGKLPSAKSIEKRAPAPLAAICDYALQRLPANRYSSAAELGEDVASFLGDGKVSVYREPTLQHIARWTVRHRTLTQVFTGLILGVVLLAAILSTYAFTSNMTLVEIELNNLEDQSLKIRSDVHDSIDYLVDDTIFLSETIEIMFPSALTVTDFADTEIERLKRLFVAYLTTGGYYRSVTLYDDDAKTRLLRVIANRPAGDDYARHASYEISDSQHLKAAKADQFPFPIDVKTTTITSFYNQEPDAGSDAPLDLRLAVISPMKIDGKTGGYLMVELDVDLMMRLLLQSIFHKPGRWAFLADAKGGLLMEASFDDKLHLTLGRGQGLEDYGPQVVAFFTDRNGPNHKVVRHAGDDRDIAFLRKIFYNDTVPSEYIGLGIGLQFTQRMADPLNLRNVIAGVFIAIFVVSGLLALIVSKLLSRASRSI